MSTDPKTLQRYRGRFAPSPTGPLHFGSLVAALGSYLDARSQGGEWQLRMEDLDRTREVSGAADQILRTLEAFGFTWDGAVIYQDRRRECYENALQSLIGEGLAYPCACSRKEIARIAQCSDEGPIYPGTCRNGMVWNRRERTIRVVTRHEKIGFNDRIQGWMEQNPGRKIGDFVLRRADGFHAYQLAVVMDDAWQGISHVVRGADLLGSTPRQCYLQQLLGLPRPSYAHLPLVVDLEGRKLSKQYQAAPVDPRHPLLALTQALAFLKQTPLPERPAHLDEFWIWAIDHWTIGSIPALRKMEVDGG